MKNYIIHFYDAAPLRLSAREINFIDSHTVEIDGRIERYRETIEVIEVF